MPKLCNTWLVSHTDLKIGSGGVWACDKEAKIKSVYVIWCSFSVDVSVFNLALYQPYSFSPLSRLWDRASASAVTSAWRPLQSGRSGHFLKVDALRNRSPQLVTALSSALYYRPLPVKFVPVGPVTSIGHQPAFPSHLPLDNLSVFPNHRPVSQSKGRGSKGATYQVDYQEVLLWLITTECAHNDCC